MTAREKEPKEASPESAPGDCQPRESLASSGEMGDHYGAVSQSIRRHGKASWRGLRTPPGRLVRAHARFERDGDSDAFCPPLGLDSQKGNAAIGRMVRWNAAKRS